MMMAMAMMTVRVIIPRACGINLDGKTGIRMAGIAEGGVGKTSPGREGASQKQDSDDALA